MAATCIALAPVFTSIIEPWVAKRPFQLRELAFGLAVLPGVALVVGGVPDGMRLGVLIGAISALLVAVFGSLNNAWSATPIRSRSPHWSWVPAPSP